MVFPPDDSSAGEIATSQNRLILRNRAKVALLFFRRLDSTLNLWTPREALAAACEAAMEEISVEDH